MTHAIESMAKTLSDMSKNVSSYVDSRPSAFSCVCPYCEVHVNFSFIHFSSSDTSLHTHLYSTYCGRNSEIWALAACPKCYKCILINFGKSSSEYSSHNVIVQPIRSPKKLISEFQIPDDISNSLYEAQLCFSVGAYNACAAMSRRTLEGICNNKGADCLDPSKDKSASLYAKINWLKEKGIINKAMEMMAEQIKEIGIDGAHENRKSPVSSEDAKAILEYTSDLVKNLYVDEPKLQARITAQKNKESK